MRQTSYFLSISEQNLLRTMFLGSRLSSGGVVAISPSSAPEWLSDAGVIQTAAMTLRLLEGDVQYHVHVIRNSYR